MQLISFKNEGAPRIGALRDNEIVDLKRAFEVSDGPAPEPGVFLNMCAFLAWHHVNSETVESLAKNADGNSLIAREEIKLLAPVPRPGKIIGVGRNYGEHATEGALAAQEQPRLFVKMPTSVIGTDEPIIRPRGIEKLDWEVELAAVVGHTMRHISEEAALDYVAGYMLLNDVSAREYQFDVAPPQTTFAKSMDTFTPTGPFLATSGSFDGSADHELRCRVNETLMQEGSTADMIFPTAYILSYISRFVTLEPGDIIATGTPSGVGHFRKPPVYLEPGDLVQIEAEGLGRLENPIIAEQ